MTHTTDTHPHTLATIAADWGCNKRAVQAWQAKAKDSHGELGQIVQGTRRFTDSEREILLSFAGPKRSPEPTPIPTPEPAEITVIEGNHRHTLEAPMVPASVDLGQFRGGSEIAAYENPLQAIQGALALTRATRQAMGSDLANRLHLYKQTEVAAAQLEAEVEALKAEQIRYQVESDLLGILQSQQTATLQKHLGKVQALGDGSGQG